MWYTSASISVLRCCMALAFLPSVTILRNSRPNSRNLDLMIDDILEVLSAENVSGWILEGTRPYFSAKSATPQKVPPSLRG